MQHRIKRSRADLVTVLAQLLDHPVAEELAFNRMMENVQPNQADEEFLVLGRLDAMDPRLSNFDNRARCSAKQSVRS